MAYTKTELKDAFCEATGYDQEMHGTKAEHITAWVTRVDEQRQRRIDRMKTGLEQAKEIAMEHILQTIRDENEDVTLT